MNHFRYLRDPLFVGGCVAYVVNRFLLKPHVSHPLLQNWFNDLLLIPCALPPLLLIHRMLLLRNHDATPTRLEISMHLVVWAFLFEGIGPQLFSASTGDPLDVAAYSIGAVFAMLWWR